MLRFCTSFVRPLLEYGSLVWSPISSLQVSQLEAVQRYFTNKIPSCRFLPYHLRLKKLSLHSLLHRRKVADLIFFHSIVTGRTLLSLAPHLLFIPPTVTRGHNLKIMVPRLKYVKTGQNFLTRCAPEWNKLPINSLDFSVEHFRKTIVISITDSCLIIV